MHMCVHVSLDVCVPDGLHVHVYVHVNVHMREQMYLYHTMCIA